MAFIKYIITDFTVEEIWHDKADELGWGVFINFEVRLLGFIKWHTKKMDPFGKFYKEQYNLARGYANNRRSKFVDEHFI